MFASQPEKQQNRQLVPAHQSVTKRWVLLKVFKMHKQGITDAMSHAKGHLPGTGAHDQHKMEKGKADTTGAGHGSHGGNKSVAASAMKQKIKSHIPGTLEHDIKKSRE